ncbi:MAG: hypothetical protein ACXVP8_03305, partial [Actinomycetota bacterium]
MSARSSGLRLAARAPDRFPGPARSFAPAPARVVTQRRYYMTSRGRRRYVVVRKRPFSHSAAIVG